MTRFEQVLIILLLYTSVSMAWWPWQDAEEETPDKIEVMDAIPSLTVEGEEAIPGDLSFQDVIEKAEATGDEVPKTKSEDAGFTREMENKLEDINETQNEPETDTKEAINSPPKKVTTKGAQKESFGNDIIEEVPIEMPEIISEWEDGEFKTTVEVISDVPMSESLHHHVEGEHNVEYDHQAFLGGDAKVFEEYTPEESREKLKKILEKIDTSGDGLISLSEMRTWISDTAKRSVAQRTEDFWSRSNPDGKDELGWDEYRARQYGFLTDFHETDKDGRYVHEDDVDSESLKIYKQLEERDKRRWTVADRDKNLQLTKAEFVGFVHPEAEPHMHDVLASETMADMDKDGDGKLNLSEYKLVVFGSDDDAKAWHDAELQLKRFRDKNGDGFVDKNELKEWILPSDYDETTVEAEHLIRESDANGDKMLSIQEGLDNYNLFVASQATDWGHILTASHDEL